MHQCFMSSRERLPAGATQAGRRYSSLAVGAGRYRVCGRGRESRCAQKAGRRCRASGRCADADQRPVGINERASSHYRIGQNTRVDDLQ